ncbi:MAG: hypothetical protein LAO05_04620 [Acidobacteriia bacterium]|nr:hypothetical protein [Terriglobia bacterium]
MASRDLVGDLVNLARGAAEAGEDWRSRLHREWLPRTVASTPRAVLVAALEEWLDETPGAGTDFASQMESVVVAAMADQGYS